MIPSSKEISLNEGYEIGAEIEKELLSAGWRRVGWKLGFTNMTLWPGQGVDASFWAPVYAQTLIARELSAKPLVQPRIEPIITTGSMIAATPVSAGQHWTNRLLGSVSSMVEITFT